jgi:polyisoprenoid-binding protein YceI
MKTGKIFIALAALLVATAFTLKTADKKTTKSVSEFENGSYTVDTENSEVEWVGRKIAYSHNGTLELASGTLEFSGDQLVGGKFDFDMTSIKNNDIEDAGKNAKLVGHLKSDDFFSVEKFPTATFKITNVTEASGDATHQITGDLTIKGITHPLTFDANVKEVNGTITAEADLTFDRSKYDVKFSSGSFFENLGDKAIYDDVEMAVNLVAKKDDVASN